jgi:serine/threonine protein kinase
VNHGILVVAGADGSFARSNPPIEVAIKVYIRARLRQILGRTQENPLFEIAAMQFIGTHCHCCRLLKSFVADSKIYAYAENEIISLYILVVLGNHEHIMGAMECCGDNDNIYTIMEFCNGGELYDVVEEFGAMAEQNARNFFGQICDGLLHLR